MLFPLNVKLPPHERPGSVPERTRDIVVGIDRLTEEGAYDADEDGDEGYGEEGEGVEGEAEVEYGFGHFGL